MPSNTLLKNPRPGRGWKLYAGGRMIFAQLPSIRLIAFEHGTMKRMTITHGDVTYYGAELRTQGRIIRMNGKLQLREIRARTQEGALVPQLLKAKPKRKSAKRKKASADGRKRKLV